MECVTVLPKASWAPRLLVSTGSSGWSWILQQEFLEQLHQLMLGNLLGGLEVTGVRVLSCWYAKTSFS